VVAINRKRGALNGGKDILTSLLITFSHRKARKAKVKRICAAAMETSGKTTASVVRRYVVWSRGLFRFPSMSGFNLSNKSLY
jgi:hypothetical protein